MGAEASAIKVLGSHTVSLLGFIYKKGIDMKITHAKSQSEVTSYDKYPADVRQAFEQTLTDVTPDEGSPHA